MNISRIEKLDLALVRASGKTRVLKSLEWPMDAEEVFLKNWRKGNMKLPEFKLKRHDLLDDINSLEGIIANCDESDLTEKFLADTAQSYVLLATIWCAQKAKLKSRFPKLTEADLDYDETRMLEMLILPSNQG
jgi:hypothetical protein